MKLFRCVAWLLLFCFGLILRLEAADKSLMPIRKTTTRGAYTIDTVGDTLGQAAPQNTRLIIRISGADQRLIKPDRIALVDKKGAAIEPVSREDRRVGHEENTGLPLSIGGYGSTGGHGNRSGYGGAGVGINLNKIFGSKADYAYTKVDWPKPVFASDKRLQIVMPSGHSFVLPLTSLAK
jgi:hypothetical protein